MSASTGKIDVKATQDLSLAGLNINEKATVAVKIEGVEVEAKGTASVKVKGAITDVKGDAIVKVSAPMAELSGAGMTRSRRNGNDQLILCSIYSNFEDLICGCRCLFPGIIRREYNNFGTC